MPYIPAIFFRAKCFARTPIHVVYGKHYEATWEDRKYKTMFGAMNFARKQIEEEEGVWQLPACKEVG